MLLVVDQGNSDVVFGLHHNNSWVVEWRTPTSDKRSEDYEVLMRQWLLDSALTPSDIHDSVVSSVVPERKPAIVDFLNRFFGHSPLVLSSELYHKLNLHLASPHEIGSDLVANAVAATDYYKDDHCIIVDFGTALTIMSAFRNNILGVSIAPGLQTAVKSLFSHTAQLPEVPLDLPDSTLGKNTIHAIQSGVLHGYVGLVSHLISETQLELEKDCRILATGGLSGILKPLHDRFDLVEPKLTLNGLKIIHQKIKN